MDLMQGRVVHARHGARDAYRPVASRLAPSAEPLEVGSALLGFFTFDALYIADLDAIQGRGENSLSIAALRARFPETEFWVDAGFASPDRLGAFRSAALGVPVIGSESQAGTALLASIAAEGSEAILSLDFKEGCLLGPEALLEQTVLWPRRVIALDLNRVGSGLGPDLALLARLRERAPRACIYAGGGVRDARDLDVLAQAGAEGVLLASALHDGSLTPGDMERARRAEAQRP